MYRADPDNISALMFSQIFEGGEAVKNVVLMPYAIPANQIATDVPPPPGLEFLATRTPSSYQSTPSPVPPPPQRIDHWQFDYYPSPAPIEINQDIDDLINLVASRFTLESPPPPPPPPPPPEPIINENDKCLLYRSRFAMLYDRAKRHRQAANHKSLKHLPFWECTDNESLAILTMTNTSFSGSAEFSSKVFVGGIPSGMDERHLQRTIQAMVPRIKFKIDWPAKSSQPRRMNMGLPGYCYLIFDGTSHVRSMLQKCIRDEEGRCFVSVRPNSHCGLKRIELIPWRTSDWYYVNPTYQNQNSKIAASTTRKVEHRKRASPPPTRKTIFVGALHGMISAQLLAKIMSEKFGPVVEARIDTDRYRYPIGSGRVTFANESTYRRAISARFLRVKTRTFKKVLQFDPFLNDDPCSKCNQLIDPATKTKIMMAFCRACFEYFCPMCWFEYHDKRYGVTGPQRRTHIPLMRDFRTNNINSSNHDSSNFNNNNNHDRHRCCSGQGGAGERSEATSTRH